MKVSKSSIFYVIIAVLTSIIIVQNSCTSTESKSDTIKIDGKKYNVIKKVTDTVYVPTNIIVYKPGTSIYKDTTIYVEVPQNVDTTQILRNYFAKNIYIDTLKLNTDITGFVVISDTISKNTIIGRQWSVSVKSKLIRETYYVNQSIRKMFIGPVFGISTNNFKSLTPTVLYLGASINYLTLNDRLYTVNVGVDTNNNIYTMCGINWKIKLRK
jgi:hypothetical protein